LRLRRSGFDVKWWGKRMAREMRNFSYIAMLKPEIVFRRVLLPAPLEPIRETIDLSSRDMDTPCNTLNSPYPAWISIS
jgi:predicted Abi (CAAX) family protease